MLTILTYDQANLQIAPSQPTSANPHRNTHHRSNTLGSIPRMAPSSSPVSFRSSGSQSPPPSAHKKQISQSQPSPLLDEEMQEVQDKEERHRQAQIAHLERLRLLILGMEQRLEVREEKLVKAVEQAENEGRRYEAAAVAAQNLVAAVGAH